MIKKIFLATAFVLLSATTSFAQTVTLPAGCVVLVPGTGGNISTNQVGSGGIIGMPDPLGGGVFTFNPLAGQTFSSWTLKGDLSIKTATLVYPPTAGSAPVQSLNGVANASATIINFNKNYRPSEGSFPSVATWARSKGTISAGFTFVSGSCSGVGRIDFEVFKTYNSTYVPNPANPTSVLPAVPAIVGPNCITAGVQCTFSVDQIASDNANDNIGFDKYYWGGLPPNTNLYYSADNSSITFTPTTSSTFILKCGFGRANPWDSGIDPQPANFTNTTFATKTVGIGPVQPGTVLVPANPLSIAFPRCIPTGTTSFSVAYSSAYTCTWTAPNTGWTVLPVVLNSGLSQTVTINTNGLNNPGTLLLAVSNPGCTTVNFQYQINRNVVAPVAILPVAPTPNCLELGSNNNKFSISADAASNDITWSFTSYNGITPAPGITLNANSPSSTVSFNVDTNAVAGFYTLTARSTSCNSTGITYGFYVRPNTPTISGPSCVVKGALTPQTYTCASSNQANYTWQFPAGWGTGAAVTTTTNSITVTPSSANAVLNGTVTVTANSASPCPKAANFTIGYLSAAPTGLVAPSCWSVGLPGTVAIAIGNLLPGTYSATMVSTAAGSTNVITSLVTTSTVGSVNFLNFSTSSLAVGSYNISITHQSGCGLATATSVLAVNVVNNNATLITNFTPGNPDNYIVLNQPANANFEWFTFIGPTVTASTVFTPIPAGITQSTLTLNGAAPPANSVICVNIFSAGSTCKTRLFVNQGTKSRMANGGNNNNYILKDIVIYPNPNTGNFFIKVPDFKQSASAKLFDKSGKELAIFNLKIGENNIQKEGIAKGTYFVVLDIDGTTEARQIIIN